MKRTLLLALIPLAPIALAAPPSTRLNPGQWRFAYHSAVTMAGRAIPRTSETTTQCIKTTDPAKLPLMPKLPSNIQCTKPALQTNAQGYHLTMSCAATEPNGMHSQLDEDFLILPGKDGNSINLDGTVHQHITGAPVPIPAALVKITAEGHRIGACPAGKS